MTDGEFLHPKCTCRSMSPNILVTCSMLISSYLGVLMKEYRKLGNNDR